MSNWQKQTQAVLKSDAVKAALLVGLIGAAYAVLAPNVDLATLAALGALLTGWLWMSVRQARSAEQLALAQQVNVELVQGLRDLITKSAVDARAQLSDSYSEPVEDSHAAAGT